MTESLLFVDDRSKRIHAALKKYSSRYDVTICPNVQEALRLLSSQEWTVVSLDFDLNGNDFQDPYDKTCAMEIIRYIEKTGWPFRTFPKIILHSSNAFGRKMMKDRLQKIGFSLQEERFVYD